MALSKIDVANMVTGATPVANGGTGQTTFAAAGLDKRPNSKPLIINGDMTIAQRATSVTGKTSSGYFTCDRWQFVANDAGTYTIAQETSTSGNAYVNGFAEAYRIDCTTADASIASDSALFIKYKLEGRDVQVFKKGTANAEPFTLAFWVKSNKTGTGQVNLRDENNTRQCSATYTISSADTWEHKICNFAADTTGALPSTNAEGFGIEWYLAAGSNFTSGTAPTAWEAISNGDSAASLNLAISGSTSNDFSLTGVQLEVGTFTSATLPPFQFESFADNLARCYRYYIQFGKNQGAGDEGIYGLGLTNNDNDGCQIQIPFPVTLRADPTAITQSGTASDYNCRTTTTDVCTGVPQFSNADKNSMQVNFQNSGHGFGTGVLVRGQTNSTDSFIGIGAEL